MRAAILLVLLALLAACAQVTPDSPDACQVEKVTSLPLRRHGNFWAVDVQVEGKPAALMLDTGATGMALTSAAATRLGTRQAGGRYTVTSGAGGTTYVPGYVIERLSLGSETVERLGALELGATHPLGDGYDGILGMIAFAKYDIDIDLPGNTLGLYRRRFCPSGPSPIPGATTFRRGELGLTAGERPMVRARLNGREARALLDTGATVTVVDSILAQSLGAPATPPEGARTGRLRTVVDPSVAMWRHRFDGLEIVGARVAQPELWVTNLGMTADLVAGQDILRHLRMWISNGSASVYIARGR